MLCWSGTSRFMSLTGLFTHFQGDSYISSCHICPRCHSHPKYSNINPALKSHLKIEQRIHFKIISITHNILHASEPQYLRKLINVKLSGKTRSSLIRLPLPPLTSKLKFSNLSFHISAPHLWISLLHTSELINPSATIS